MRNGKGPVVAAILALGLMAGPARAGDDGLVLRAVGWYAGIASISEDAITCQIPDIGSGFPDSTFEVGLWNTFGFPTTSFPNQFSAFGNPCGGWIQAWNSMKRQGINVTKVVSKYKIAGARQFRSLVPMRRRLPRACQQFRKQALFTGVRLDPNNPFAEGSSGSGAPNVAFFQVFPQFNAGLLGCIRDNFAPLTTDVYASLSLVSRTKIYGVADNGEKYRSNAIRYTLTLSHTCGNGRVDNFEECDPTATGLQCTGRALCAGGECFENPTQSCSTSSDCIGTCQPQGGRDECSCVY